MYFDFTRRCFCLTLLGRFDVDVDEHELDVDLWLMDGVSSSSLAAAEGCSSHS